MKQVDRLHDESLRRIPRSIRNKLLHNSSRRLLKNVVDVHGHCSKVGVAMADDKKIKAVKKEGGKKAQDLAYVDALVVCVYIYVFV